MSGAVLRLGGDPARHRRSPRPARIDASEGDRPGVNVAGEHADRRTHVDYTDFEYVKPPRREARVRAVWN